MFFLSSCLFFSIFLIYKITNEVHLLRMLLWCMSIILLLFIILFIWNLEFYGLLIMLIYIGAICVLFLFIIFTVNSSLFQMEAFFGSIRIFLVLLILNYFFFQYYFLTYIESTEINSIKFLNILLDEKNYLGLFNKSLIILDENNDSQINQISTWLPVKNKGVPLFGGIFFFKKYYYCSFFVCWLLFFFVVFLALCLKLYKVSFKTVYSKLKIQQNFSQMIVRKKI